MSDLNLLLDACARIVHHVSKFPDEPITFDKAIRSEFKSSLRVCLKSVGYIKDNLFAFYEDPEIRASMGDYLRSILVYNGPYVDTYGQTMYENPTFKAVRDLAYLLHYEFKSTRFSLDEAITEENIDRLADFEKLVAAGLQRRRTLRMKFKLKYANMVDC